MAAVSSARRSIWIALCLTLLGCLYVRSLLSSRSTALTLRLPTSTSKLFPDGNGMTLKSLSSIIPKLSVSKTPNPLLIDGEFSHSYMTIGQRMQHFADLLRLAYERQSSGQWRAKIEIEAFTSIVFPFLGNSKSPFQTLRDRPRKGSKGITLPVSKPCFRFALHLLSALRSPDVLNSSLPIEIAYSGLDALPKEYHDALTSQGKDISMLDISQVFDLKEKTADIKALAVLASKFENVILLDPSVVPVQDPALLFEDKDYKKTGAFLFGADPEIHSAQQRINEQRQQQLESQIVADESEKQHEEGDGMVVLNKSRLEVMTAALFVAWQSTQKEKLHENMSWRASFESCTVPYAFSAENGVLGASEGEIGEDATVCGQHTAYFYSNKPSGVLWYSGSLLKDIRENGSEFEVPEYWMKGKLEGKRERCMAGGVMKRVDEAQKEFVRKAIAAVEVTEGQFTNLIGSSQQE